MENNQLTERWATIANPGSEHTERAFSEYLQVFGKQRNVLNCALPVTQAKNLTEVQLPPNLSVQDCIDTSITGNFSKKLDSWSYKPKIQAEVQLPQMLKLPNEHASLIKTPWFQSPSPSTWLGINARHLRYNHQLWQDIKPKVLQGVTTTLIMGLPQIGYALTPHIQLDKSFLFLASLARGLTPIQLFPAKYLYPDANLGEIANAPAPMLADILPVVGGFSYPVVDCEPDPWRVLARFENSDRYYGYPFRKAANAIDDFTLQDHENGVMLLPNGKRVTARHSESYVYATLDPLLKDELQLDREGFEDANCLVRGACTHDGLPFQLPVEMQSQVFAIVLTHWKMELDKPGDLSSYVVTTEHAAIRGYNYYQKVEPFYTNFMRMIQELSKDPDFKTYPLSNHLNHSWLGGNLRVANQCTTSEAEIGADLLRSYYHQQLDWQSGVINLMNHVSFRTKSDRAGLVSKTGQEIENSLNKDGLALHQMQRMLRFDSHLFQRPLRKLSPWPDLHPGWTELDQKVLTESLPKL